MASWLWDNPIEEHLRQHGERWQAAGANRETRSVGWQMAGCFLKPISRVRLVVPTHSVANNGPGYTTDVRPINHFRPAHTQLPPEPYTTIARPMHD